MSKKFKQTTIGILSVPLSKARKKKRLRFHLTYQIPT